KDMIIRSGLKVYPARVEEILRRCAGVLDVAVFGRPDLLHSEVVAAAVVTAPDTDFTELKSRLIESARHHLAPYEVPTAFERIAEIPRTPLGKVQKNILRDGLLAGGLARRDLPTEEPSQAKEVT
ncbi:MAG TPA: class I adenylate-forming enzyme family protein, partial [Tepidisphaeraceae bacterium]|nr:class I adenylate-forming enzyme family protein [Tepidisphaeraceae bacterium]